MRPGLIPGVNVDKVDVAAGVAQARKLGYTSPEELMVIEYALMRWKRGEEDGAEATLRSHGINDFTSWRVILAVAIVTAPETEAEDREFEARTILNRRGISLDIARSFTLEQIEALAEVVKAWDQEG